MEHILADSYSISVSLESSKERGERHAATQDLYERGMSPIVYSTGRKVT